MIQTIREKLLDFQYRCKIKSMLAKADFEKTQEKIRKFGEDNKGIAVIEVILILVVVMALAVIFRKKLKKIFDDIFKQIQKSNDEIIKSF